MRKLIIVLMLTLSISAYCQTTDEEYNYITKGYAIQLSSGLDMKKGYHFEHILRVCNNDNRIFIFQYFVNEKENRKCAIMVTYLKENNNPIYLCIPDYNSLDNVWNMYYSTVLENSTFDFVRSYSLALSKLYAKSFSPLYGKYDSVINKPKTKTKSK